MEKPNLLAAEAKYLLQWTSPPFYPVETVLYHMEHLDHCAQTQQLPIPIPTGLQIEKSSGEDGCKHMGHVHHEHDELVTLLLLLLSSSHHHCCVCGMVGVFYCCVVLLLRLLLLLHCHCCHHHHCCCLHHQCHVCYHLFII